MNEIKHFLFNQDLPQNLNNIGRKKMLQKMKIVRHLYLSGDKTNADICDKFNTSLPTSMSLLNQLVKEGMVRKKGYGHSGGGRKPDIFGLNENTFFILSIHVERFKIRMAILNNAHQILHEKTIPIVISPDSEVVDFLYEHAQDLLSTSKIDLDVLMGIGISMPGLVSTTDGRNLTYFLKDQETKPLREAMENKFKKPVAVFNDANSACLAEFRLGLAKKKKDVLVISMDWGIGLGIIMGGDLQTGTSGFAGEFGHIPVVEHGALCYCGKAGCLETVASGLALAKEAKERIKNGHATILNSLSEIENLEPDAIIHAANQGDQFSINLLSEIGNNLGKGLAILIQIFNPEMIILGGQIAEAKQFITTPVQHSINLYSKMQLQERTSIVLSDLGKESSLLGVTLAVMDRVFNDKISSLKTEAN